MTNFAVDRSKWQSMSIFEQMGNIGSEVGRTFSSQKLNDGALTDSALARALDLFDATVESDGLSQSRKKEILRSKEQFLAAVNEPTQQASIENYFTQFAIAARLSR